MKETDLQLQNRIMSVAKEDDKVSVNIQFDIVHALITIPEKVLETSTVLKKPIETDKPNNVYQYTYFKDSDSADTPPEEVDVELVFLGTIFVEGTEHSKAIYLDPGTDTVMILPNPDFIEPDLYPNAGYTLYGEYIGVPANTSLREDGFSSGVHDDNSVLRFKDAVEPLTVKVVYISSVGSSTSKFSKRISDDNDNKLTYGINTGTFLEITKASLSPKPIDTFPLISNLNKYIIGSGGVTDTEKIYIALQ